MLPGAFDLFGVLTDAERTGTIFVGATSLPTDLSRQNATRSGCHQHSVREDIARRGILDGIRDRLTSPDGVLEMRTRVAAQLRDYSNKVDGELRDLRARLERTEEKMAGLADFLAGGDRSPYIVATLQDHEVFAEQDRRVISALEAEAQEPLYPLSIPEVEGGILVERAWRTASRQERSYRRAAWFSHGSAHHAENSKPLERAASPGVPRSSSL